MYICVCFAVEAAPDDAADAAVVGVGVVAAAAAAAVCAGAGYPS